MSVGGGGKEIKASDVQFLFRQVGYDQAFAHLSDRKSDIARDLATGGTSMISFGL